MDNYGKNQQNVPKVRINFFKKSLIIKHLISAKAIDIMSLLMSKTPTGFKRAMIMHISHSYIQYPAISPCLCEFYF